MAMRTACGVAAAVLFLQSSVALAEDRPTSAVSLKGVVSEYDGPAPNELLNNLVKSALERNDQREQMLAKAKHYKSVFGRASATARQMAQLATEYRGFELSSEAADVILDEKIRLKSKSSVDYAQQKHVDEVHTQLFAALMQIAEATGLNEADRREKALHDASASLTELVGEEEAKKALQAVTAWADQVVVPEWYLKQQSLTVMEIQSKTEALSKQALQSDPITNYARRILHRYNSHSNIVRASAKMINTAFTIGMLSPTAVAPAAQFASFAYAMATGGPEESKLLRELYLDKSLECRGKRVTQEVGQAVNGYNSAITTKNPVLFAFSESMMSAICGEDATSSALGNKPLVAKKSSRDNEISCVRAHGAL